MGTDYYRNKADLLCDLFGSEPIFEDDAIRFGEVRYPVVDDVIVVLDVVHWPASVRRRLQPTSVNDPGSRPFAEEIQFSFGAEWKTFSEILPEHEREFRQYFDIVDPSMYRGRRVCDFGAGIGRWSHFLKSDARELVLVDFSEAIFVARNNLRDTDNAVFVLGDVAALPFKDDVIDFAFCLGVLHHLPIPALEGVRRLARYADVLLIYLYSALDGRPLYYRMLFKPVHYLRLLLSRVRSEAMRNVICWMLTLGIYLPAILLFRLLTTLRLIERPPFLEFYESKSIGRLRQDAYDRFFTTVEQRVSRDQIGTLSDTFGEVTISDGLPYWHFLCRNRRKRAGSS